MLAELLNRDLVMSYGTEVVSALTQDADPDDQSVRDVVFALQGAAQVPSSRLSPNDRVAFVPSHPQLSLIQAIVDQRVHEGSPIGAARSRSTRDRVRLRAPEGDTSPLVTRELVRGRDDGLRQRDVDAFEPRDPKWWAKVSWEVVRYLGKRRKFSIPEREPESFNLDPHARVILVGDWGTGAAAAVAVANAVRSWMLAAGDRQCHVIHLGDVYYAGTKWEAEHRFLTPWPVRAGEADRYFSWSLNGNHDMYAAGEGLFEVTLKDKRFQRQHTVAGPNEATSLFRLVNPKWQILGLDTAWKFHLADPGNMHGALGGWQSPWLAHRAADGPETILLSHHQPFSRTLPYPALVTPEKNLAAEARGALDRGVAAWFWGHEHRCISFPDPDLAGLSYGACIGNGAMPQEEGKALAGGTEWEFRQTRPPDPDGELWRVCGFAVLDFHGDDRPTITYVDQHGAPCRDADTLEPAPRPVV